jgi:hypothetical protein
VADVAYGENAGDVGFEQEWIAVECPAFRALAVAD